MALANSNRFNRFFKDGQDRFRQAVPSLTDISSILDEQTNPQTLGGPAGPPRSQPTFQNVSAPTNQGWYSPEEERWYDSEMDYLNSYSPQRPGGAPRTDRDLYIPETQVDPGANVVPWDGLDSNGPYRPGNERPQLTNTVDPGANPVTPLRAGDTLESYYGGPVTPAVGIPLTPAETSAGVRSV